MDSSHDNGSNCNLLQHSQRTVIEETQNEIDVVDGTQVTVPDLPPVDSTQLPPSPASNASYYSPSNDGSGGFFSPSGQLQEDEERYDPTLVESVAEFSFCDRLDYFLAGRITSLNRVSVEHTVLCEAGRIVSRDTVVTADKRSEMLVDAYKETLSSISEHMFESSELRQDMMTRQKGGHKSGMKARTL